MSLGLPLTSNLPTKLEFFFSKFQSKGVRKSFFSVVENFKFSISKLRTFDIDRKIRYRSKISIEISISIENTRRYRKVRNDRSSEISRKIDRIDLFSFVETLDVVEDTNYHVNECGPLAGCSGLPGGWSRLWREGQRMSLCIRFRH